MRKLLGEASLIFLVTLIFVFEGNAVPHWEDLECEVKIYLLFSSVLIVTQEGHKYLFSDATHSWDEALVECELYGGWLVNIGGVREHNCLLEFGHSKAELVDKWYWTGGKYGNHWKH